MSRQPGPESVAPGSSPQTRNVIDCRQWSTGDVQFRGLLSARCCATCPVPRLSVKPERSNHSGGVVQACDEQLHVPTAQARRGDRSAWWPSWCPSAPRRLEVQHQGAPVNRRRRRRGCVCAGRSSRQFARTGERRVAATPQAPGDVPGGRRWHHPAFSPGIPSSGSMLTQLERYSTPSRDSTTATSSP